MSEEIEGLGRRGLARVLRIGLDVVFYLALAAGSLWLLSLAVSVFTEYDDGWEIRVPVAIGEGSVFPQLPVEVAEKQPLALENVRIWGGQGSLRLLHHSLPLHLGNSANFLLALGVFLWAITLLRRVLATTAAGRPFDPANPRRLNALGWIVLAASVLSSMHQYLTSRWILSKVEVTTLPLSSPILLHKEWVLSGLLLLVLAAIWREGVRIAEEQSLTV